MTNRQEPNLDEKLLSRIQKLLALADPERNDSQAQIEAALDKVTELLDRYSLTKDDVEKYTSEDRLTHDHAFLHRIDDECVLLKSKCSGWMVNLGSAIANACYCKGLYSPSSVTFIGRKRDVEIAVFMMMSLTKRLIDLSRQEMKQYIEAYKKQTGKTAWHRHGSEHPRIWRRNWLEGASSSLGLRISEPRRRERREVWRQANETKNQRAIISLHDDAVEKYFQEHMPTVASRPPLSDEKIKVASNNMSAWFRGHDTGNRIDIREGVGETATNKNELLNG